MPRRLVFPPVDPVITVRSNQLAKRLPTAKKKKKKEEKKMDELA
jgi:hypothetical protein